MEQQQMQREAERDAFQKAMQAKFERAGGKALEQKVRSHVVLGEGRDGTGREAFAGSDWGLGWHIMSDC
jgi:hypothetical protein